MKYTCAREIRSNNLLLFFFFLLDLFTTDQFSSETILEILENNFEISFN